MRYADEDGKGCVEHPKKATCVMETLVALENDIGLMSDRFNRMERRIRELEQLVTGQDNSEKCVAR